MNRFKRMFVYTVIFIAVVASLFVIVTPNDDYELKVNVSFEESDTLQIFYSESLDFNEEHSIKLDVTEQVELVKKEIDLDNNFNYIRLDFSNIARSTMFLDSLVLSNSYVESEIYYEELLEEFQRLVDNGLSNDIYEIYADGEILRAVSSGDDPYFIVSKEFLLGNSAVSPLYILRVLVVILLSLIVTLIIYKYVYLKDVYKFFKNIIGDRKLLISLAKNDFKIRYAGSYFGIMWAFVQPICTILVFWFVFQMGFKSADIGEIPYALWLAVGLVPWFFFSDALNSATNTFVEYSYLVKKVVFKIDILPIVKIISALFVHMFFILFLFTLLLINGIKVEIKMVMVFYYTLCMIVYVTGISFITSSIVIFFKDLTQIISIVLQFGMWLTPIMWQIDAFDEKIIKVFRYNPMFYIIEGYRNSMLGEFVLPNFQQTVYFWFITILVFFMGISLFRRLKVHFADVL